MSSADGDEQQLGEQTTTSTASTKNAAPKTTITNGNVGWGGGGGGGGGLSISIRSTSRENLTEPDPPVTKKQSAVQARGGKSATSSASSSVASASKFPSSQAPSSAQQQTTNKVSATTTIETTATTTASVPKRIAPVAPATTKTSAAATKITSAMTKTTPAVTKTMPAMTKTTPATQTTPAETRTTSAAVKTVAPSQADSTQNNVTPRPTGNKEEEFTDLDDMNTPRMNLINWDPKPVLDELYKVNFLEETAEDISHNFISMEGLMEKLPMNKKKSTLLKTWKRRFFKAHDGWIQYYETSNRDKPSETIQLMGGRIDDMGNRILGIDDGRGHYLMVRAPTDKEHGQWKIALESQTEDNATATYVQPVQKSAPHPTKHVVVIDMGSSAIRAGVLGEKVTLPQVFFPSVVAVDKETGKKVVGTEAYHPDVRKRSTLLHPIRPSNRVDQFNIDVDMMSAIFGKVFDELKVDPSKYMVMLSTPQTLSDSLRAGLMNALIGNLGVQGVCMVQQSLLALYSYRTSTGIIVDIGHRIEILPIYDGFVIEGGVARCPYGSQKVIDSLKKALLETNFKFASEVEHLLVRYIMEQSCYVAHDYRDEDIMCETQPGKLKRDVNLSKFGMPEGAYKTVEVEEGRFSSPEGFFNVDLWEMDYPTLHKLIFHAIQSCPMDNRRHMYRSVYLSGGVTMLPGFQDRLLNELKKLAPPAVTVEVHAASNRYHAAYLGACSVAGMPQFKDMAISSDEWRREGARAFKKWQTVAS